MAKIKISPKTGLLQSEVGFGVKGKVLNNSVTTKEGEGKKNGTPYVFAEFSVDSFDHKLKVKAGGSKPKNLYVYDYDAKETEKIDYKKDFVSSKKNANLIGIKYTTDGNEEGVKCDFDFASSIKDIIVDDTYEIYGKIDFRRYKNDDGDVKTTKELKLSNIKSTKSEEELHHFDIKNFLFTRMVDKKSNGKVVKKNGYVEGYVLGYSEIIPVRLDIGDEGLAETLADKKIVKPYTLMTVIGEISNKPEVEEAPKVKVKKGSWGEVKTSYGMAKSFSFMKMTVLKVDPSTLLHGKVTEKLLQEAIKKTNEVEDQYASPVKSGNWGTDNKTPNLDKAEKEPTKVEEEEAVVVEDNVKERAVIEDDPDSDFDWDDE